MCFETLTKGNCILKRKWKVHFLTDCMIYFDLVLYRHCPTYENKF